MLKKMIYLNKDWYAIHEINVYKYIVNICGVV